MKRLVLFILKLFKIEVMETFNYQVLIITSEKTTLSDRMTKSSALLYITSVFKEQPLQHFNENHGVFIIDSQSKTVRSPKLTIEF